jgi:hypothetical protein
MLTCFALMGILVIGCGEKVPVAPMPEDGSNPHVSGSPEERIKNIEADMSLAPEERARRIKIIKERNHLK